MPKDFTRAKRTTAILAATASIGACLAMARSPASAAPTLSSIYSFAGGTDGAGPVAGLIGDATNSVFYGTTPAGGGTGCGKAGCGTVFKLTPPAEGQTQWTETVLYSFTAGADGAAPMAGLTPGANGVFYGTTYAGGAAGAGTVFVLTPPSPGQTSWIESVIYSFGAFANDGLNPMAPLLIDKTGSLYGTTYAGGGAARGYGTVFRLSPPKTGQAMWTETQLLAITNPHFGAAPTTGVIMDQTGALYGTLSYNTIVTNRSELGCGTIFKLAPNSGSSGAWTETNLAFLQDQAPNVCHASGPLYMDAQGILYDTALALYSTNGGALSLTPPAPGQTAWVLANIDNNPHQDFRPYSGLVADSLGNLYGTSAGFLMKGANPIAGAYIFELARPLAGGSWKQKILASFDITNGALPKSPLLLAKDGTLYGTAQAGGAYGFGTVFALTRPGK